MESSNQNEENKQSADAKNDYSDDDDDMDEMNDQIQELGGLQDGFSQINISNSPAVQISNKSQDNATSGAIKANHNFKVN